MKHLTTLPRPHSTSVACLFIACTVIAHSAAADPARDIVNASGVKGGLVVHLGCDGPGASASTDELRVLAPRGVVMMRANSNLWALQIAIAATVFSSVGLQPATAEDTKPVSQFVYKVIGDRKLKADILYPEDWTANDHRATIVFFSGGAWRSGGTTQFAKQAEYFAKRGMVTVRAEYRDSTRDKAKPDTCLKDAVSAMRWVRKHAAMLGINPQRIVSSGGSAGGYLAAAVATIDDFHSESDDLSVSPKPNAMVLFNPVVDFVTLDRAAEFGIVGDLAVRISPLQHVKKPLPPTLILIGSEDPFLGQNRQFVSKGEKLGVRVELDLAEGQPHAYFNRSPWLGKTVASADRFLVSLGYLDKEPEVELPVSTTRK